MREEQTESDIVFSFPQGQWQRMSQLAYYRHVLQPKLCFKEMDYMVWEADDSMSGEFYMIEVKKYFNPERQVYTKNLKSDAPKILDEFIQKLLFALLYLRHKWHNQGLESAWQNCFKAKLKDNGWPDVVLCVVDVDLDKTQLMLWQAFSDQFDQRVRHLLEVLLIPPSLSPQKKLRVEVIHPKIHAEFFPNFFPARP